MGIAAPPPFAVIPGGNLRGDNHCLTIIKKIGFANDS
jgi:hypothetical protein